LRPAPGAVGLLPADALRPPGDDQGRSTVLISALKTTDSARGIMKIASIECLPVHSGWRKNFVFVRVATDAGVVGWGEAYSQYDRDRAIAAQVEELGRYLIGRDPAHIRHFLQIAFDDYAQRRGSLELYCAISGIEQALWDIAGKVAQQPIYNL